MVVPAVSERSVVAAVPSADFVAGLMPQNRTAHRHKTSRREYASRIPRQKSDLAAHSHLGQTPVMASSAGARGYPFVCCSSIVPQSRHGNFRGPPNSWEAAPHPANGGAAFIR